MKRLALALIAAAVLALTSRFAHADLASSITPTAIQGAFTDHTSSGVPPVDHELNDLEGNSAGILDVTASFDATQSQFVIIIYTGAYADAFLAFVSFNDTSTGESASWFAADPTTDGVLVANSANIFIFDINAGGGTYDLISSGLFGNVFDEIILDFEFYVETDRLTILAIEVPEPGTYALFALGAAGLAWTVRRRKRRLAAASAAAAP